MRTSLGGLFVCAVMVAVASVPTAHASPPEDLAAARDAFRAGDCAVALPLLTQLLYPTPRLAQPEQLADAHLLYGACLVTSGDTAGGAREFEEAMFVQSDVSLDPMMFSAESVRVFAQTKASVDVRIKQEAETRALAEEREALRKYKESLIFYEVRPYYLNFVPGGIGQFQRGSIGKGLFFASTQLVTAAASAGIWVYLVQNYGYGGSVPREDAAFARRLQQIEIGTGVAFLGLVAWGIVDSLIHYKPQVKVSGDDSLLGPGRPAATSASAWERLRIAPTPMASGGGLSLGFDY